MRFRLTLLGTNGAVPTPRRFASAQFLESETTDVLVDCGEGTQLRLQRAGLSMGRVEVILISHLHGDHYFGLPGLLTSLALNGRSRALTVVSPSGLREKLAPMLQLDRWRLPFALDFREHQARDLRSIVDTGDLEVLAFPLRHRIATNGYLLREKMRPPNIRKDKIRAYDIPYTAIPEIKAGGDFRLSGGTVIRHSELVAPASAPRSYAYCSDTMYFEELSDYVRGVDLLYHEATFLHEMVEEAHQKGHATAREAALTARNAGAGTLIMGHYSGRYDDVTAFEAEAREVFPRSYAGRDLYRYDVPYVSREEVDETG